MDKKLSMILYGYDINDDEAFANHCRSLVGLGPIYSTKDDNQTNIGIDINPSELFKDSPDSKSNAVSKSVVVRGPKVGDVKKVVMSPNGDITVYHGGL